MQPIPHIHQGRPLEAILDANGVVTIREDGRQTLNTPSPMRCFYLLSRAVLTTPFARPSTMRFVCFCASTPRNRTDTQGNTGRAEAAGRLAIFRGRVTTRSAAPASPLETITNGTLN